MLKVLAKTFFSLPAFTLGVALATGSPVAYAAETTLQPYTAQYRTTARGIGLNLTRKLQANKDGSYTLTNGGKIMVVGFQEISVFNTDEEKVLPKSYVYQGSGLINRRREVHFTPGSDVIRSLYKDQWYDLPYTEGTLDRMSQQEQLRLFLLNDPTPKEDITIRVADGKRVKDYTLTFRGEEEIETPMGKFNTLHFERIHDEPDRSSNTWIAPELDYLMVKTVHIEDGKPVEMVLLNADIGK
ncbi:hypothetical protein BST95_18125 [Halioglobus japonicus]|uniref:DUF3108 domain-containing protein n=1 Tax=Halioglobus japonicus TaxID=930805 RepID=A0AAP8SP06_9GAMM|nr:DUF3108 domain-containing protein [Halioglobus japonicus]AQA19880.1 hypothetical protein BST95_18125 [Halioglobus japonicus]PLW87044.1 DUF3108 domain-containing protein [Halioglobus japonicus]GHD10509.1 hypothetical protein GCM10007052_09860 [Halioglobus japonicus]